MIRQYPACIFTIIRVVHNKEALYHGKEKQIRDYESQSKTVCM